MFIMGILLLYVSILLSVILNMGCTIIGIIPLRELRCILQLILNSVLKENRGDKVIGFLVGEF